MTEKTRFDKEPEAIFPREKIDESEQKEWEKLEKLSRREFFKKLAAGAAILGFGSLETLIASGCMAGKTGLRSEEILRGLERFQKKELKDPYGYLKYLRDREFVIQNEIFDAFAKTVDKKPWWLSSPTAGYLAENYLDTKEEQEEFRTRLQKLGLPQNEIAFYESLFKSTDILIFRESALQEKEFFPIAVAHERFHQAIKKLSSEEYELMKKTAQEIIYLKEGSVPFVREKYHGEKAVVGFYIAAASMNWEEFYTYLAQGEFDERVEDMLKNYPKAYAIFSRIKEACKFGTSVK